jgi:hypothetical protein
MKAWRFLATLLVGGGCVAETGEEANHDRSSQEATAEGDPCRTHTDCGDGLLCRFADGSCGAADGVCTVAAAAPCEAGAPVCGCDGRDYASSCDAWQTGVSLWYVGGCDGAAPPPVDDPGATCGGVVCAQDEFCFSDDGTCGPGQGHCVRMDGACTASALPACGCDGYTYETSCEAIRAGVSILHTGPC